MIKNIFLSIGLIVTMGACSQIAQQSNTLVNQNFGIKKIKNHYVIDTAMILNNKNLDTLLVKLDNSELVDKNRTKDIPDFINAFLTSATPDKFSIANPGEKWQSTDVVMEKLPNRQLIYLGIGSDLVLLTYYSGGIGESEHILIFRYKDKDIIDFWCGNVLDDVKDKKGIVTLLKKNRNKHWGLNTNIIYL